MRDDRLSVSYHLLPLVSITLAHTAGLPAQLSADAAAALEAGLLPCLAHLVTRMGAGRKSGAAWCRPTSYPGVAVCCRELLLLGPVDKVAALLSASGERLRGAVVELRGAMAVAWAPRATRDAVHSMGWCADVLRGGHDARTRPPVTPVPLAGVPGAALGCRFGARGRGHG